jgi:hypothetical protein
MTSDETLVPVHVDFLLETNDLFRVNLGLAAFRILLGLGFSVALVSGLIIFFLMLDEKLILLQTSPLFVGFPLLAVGGQILRLHAICRRYVRGMSSAQRRHHFRFLKNSGGFDLAAGESSAHISWTDVSKVVEKRNYFLIYLNKFDACVVPKKAIRVEDFSELHNILSPKLTPRATLSD